MTDLVGEHEPVIRISGLTKHYGRHKAVDDVSFDVRAGTIVGFLGPNGAGRSTTLRMLVGLTPPTSGRCTILGSEYQRLTNPGTRVGVMLDASAQHSGRTGREVLTLGALMMSLEAERVEETLDLVGLTPAEAGRRTGDYSLGMRQRLGVGHALLGGPGVLILDEPANGLDPEGIHWMRGLLREFADRGGSVLLSSHLLREIEVIADELVVIGRGEIVAQGAKADLLAGGGTLARGLDDDALSAALNQAGLAHSVSADGALTTMATAEQISRAAMAAGAVLVELRPAELAGLEDMFLRLTAGHSRGTEEGARR